jgi:nuclear transport factor 2 (NTF2) superfamily protein
MTDTPAPRAPLPPFDEVTARQKVLLAESAWNTKDPERLHPGFQMAKPRSIHMWT